MAVTELSLAECLVVVNAMTLFPKALPKAREAAGGSGRAWSTNHAETLVSACHTLTITSCQNSYVKTLSSQCSGIGR